MASVLELVYEDSEQLKDRARETYYDDNVETVQVSQTVAELQLELADEDLGEEAYEILDAKLSDLKDQIDEPQGPKAAVQEALLERLLSGESQTSTGGDGGSSATTAAGPDAPASRDGRAIFPGNGLDGVPPEDLSSHFHSQEERYDAIRNAAQEATQLAFDKQCSYVVLENLRPSKETEPLRVQRAADKRREDELLVFEARVPMSPFPVENSTSSPIARLA